MAANIFWNLVFLLDVGGVIALALYAAARWTWIVHSADALLALAGLLVVLLLVGGFIYARLTEWRNTPGVTIHGQRYTDWRRN